MRRDFEKLGEREVDLAVVGGGIFGACAAWDAVQRGLSVALIERDDFASASSAHSFKLIHGGIRYLQHADVKRVRESSDERRAFLRVAPHQVRPLPIVIPTSGFGMRGKAVMRIGLGLYDLLTHNRNRGLADELRKVPFGTMLPLREVLDFAPDLARERVTGGALFHDGQMYNPPRLVLAFVRKAADAGAIVANYAEAESFLRDGNRILGVTVRDTLGGGSVDLRAKIVLNAAGPYAERLLARGLGTHGTESRTYSRDTCFVVNRRLFGKELALAVQGATKDPEAVLSRGERHLFFAPWRHYTLVGVWHKIHGDDPDTFKVTPGELQSFLNEINGSYPAFQLTPADVSRVNCGLVPFGENAEGAQDLKYGHRSTSVDHAAVDGVEGLITLIGIRYTMGRLEAERAVDLAYRKLGRPVPPCRTTEIPVHGGVIDDLGVYQHEMAAKHGADLSPEVVRALVHNHGSALDEILAHGEESPDRLAPLDGTTTLAAEVVHAVREEMAQTLADVLYRRTDIATGAEPAEVTAVACARLMGAELGWDEGQVNEELDRWRRIADPLMAQPRAEPR